MSQQMTLSKTQYSLSVFLSVFPISIPECAFQKSLSGFQCQIFPLCLWTMFQFSEHAYCLKFWEILWQFRVLHNKPFSQYVINYNRREKGPHGGWRHWTHYSKTSLSEKQKNMPCCQNRLWRLIYCFYRKNLGSKKRAHCPTWRLTLPTFLEISSFFGINQCAQ